MKNLTVFNHEKFGRIRITDKNNESWFIGKDICNALDLENVSKAVNRLDNDEKDTITLSNSEGKPHTNLIVNESGLYSLILSSRKESSKEFKKWVTHDVLPSIRKTGKYEIIKKPREILIAEALIESAKMIEEYKEVISKLEDKIESDKPLIEGYNRIVGMKKGEITMGDLAKLISKEGHQIGRNQLFEFLRYKNALTNSNSPYQKYMNKYFDVKGVRVMIRGCEEIKPQTIVLPKGIDFVLKLFVKEGLIKEQDKLDF